MKTKIAILLLGAVLLPGCNITLSEGHGHYVRPVHHGHYVRPVYGPAHYYGPLHRQPSQRYYIRRR